MQSFVSGSASEPLYSNCILIAWKHRRRFDAVAFITSPYWWVPFHVALMRADGTILHFEKTHHPQCPLWFRGRVKFISYGDAARQLAMEKRSIRWVIRL